MRHKGTVLRLVTADWTRSAFEGFSEETAEGKVDNKYCNHLIQRL